MRWTSEMLGSYTDAVTAQQRAAQIFVETSIRALAEANPDATVAELREYGIEVLSQAYRAYGDRAAVEACRRYDDIASSFFPDYGLEAASISNDIDMDAVERDARYLAGLVERRGVGEYARRMAEKAYDHALRAANATMAANASREADRRAGMLFARVPTGRETCGFCLMLASLGFNYTSRRAAGDIGGRFNAYHSHCDCRVVVGDESTTVDGYDPDWLRDVYSDARAAVEGGAWGEWRGLRDSGRTSKSYDKFLRDRICREIETRDRGWAWTGREPESVLLPGARPNDEELATISRLRGHGFRIESRPTRDLEMLKTSDTFFVYPGEAEGETRRVEWEIKNAKGDGKQTIYHLFEDAAGQSTRVVIDLANTPAGGRYDDAGYAVERTRKFIRYHYTVDSGADAGTVWQFDEAILLLKDGTMRRIKRGN